MEVPTGICFWVSMPLAATHLAPQQGRQLLGFVMLQDVPSICDKNHGYPQLPLGVYQLAECFQSSWDHSVASNQHSINVEQ